MSSYNTQTPKDVSTHDLDDIFDLFPVVRDNNGVELRKHILPILKNFLDSTGLVATIDFARITIHPRNN